MEGVLCLYGIERWINLEMVSRHLLTSGVNMLHVSPQDLTTIITPYIFLEWSS